MNPETEIQNDIRVEASRLGARLFRYVVGTFYNRARKPCHIGTAGVADLIGWREVTITSDLVGQKLAQFVAVEVKTETGKVSEEQKSFLSAVEKSGGLAMVARSAKEIAGAFGLPPPRNNTLEEVFMGVFMTEKVRDDKSNSKKVGGEK
jgi:hypothetical protein